MTKFEQIGSNRQYSAKTVEEAKIEMDISCYSCTHCSRCLWADCHSCQIRLAHQYMVASLADAEALKDA